MGSPSSRVRVKPTTANGAAKVQTIAKSGVNMAVHDLLARSWGVRPYELPVAAAATSSGWMPTRRTRRTRRREWRREVPGSARILCCPRLAIALDCARSRGTWASCALADVLCWARMGVSSMAGLWIIGLLGYRRHAETTQHRGSSGRAPNQRRAWRWAPVHRVSRLHSRLNED
jgi:hypothetical protein